jgi:hypothetical protein
MTQINKIMKSKRSVPFAQLEGGDGLSVSRVFSHNKNTLARLLVIVSAESEIAFTTADIKGFYNRMDEVFYDSKSHFARADHWFALRAKYEKSPLVDPNITVHFKKNPEAARALLEEMARSWASDDAATTGNIDMTRQAVRMQVDKFRAEPEKLMAFIGSRYAAGRYGDAALALKYSRRRALATAKKYEIK